MRAREAAGVSRTQLASLTRIPERHLAAIEAGDFAALPARTYAVGFSRSYAKALGLDESSIANDVRAELAEQAPEPPRRGIPTFEPGDPARVPSARLTWLAALGAAVVILAGLLLWRSPWAPGGSLPSILPQETSTPAAAATAAPASPNPAGPVVFTALEPDIWVKFYDGTGKQLMQKQMAQGETWTVPADQGEVLIWTGRPEALSITVGGQRVPNLSDVQRTLKDVPVTAAALLARGQEPAASPASTGGVPAAAAPARSAPQARRAEPRPRPSPRAQQTQAPAAPATAAPPPSAAGDPHAGHSPAPAPTST